MSSQTSNKKSFKFILGPKRSRKPTVLKCPRKGTFKEYTMKITQQPEFQQTEKSANSNSGSPNSMILSRTSKVQGTFQTMHFDDFQTPDPLYFRMQHNLQVQRLRNFIYSNFSTPSSLLNEDQISNFIGMLPLGEQQLIDRLLANALKIRLHYPFEPPVYRGHAKDITTMVISLDSKIKPEMIRINEAIEPLEEHLVKLLFKYYNPFSTLAHPDYFEYRLKFHWNQIDFQALLAMILCCACPYLVVEPFDLVVNYSQLAEMYFERSHSLYDLIDPNDLSAYPSKIQTNLLSVQLDYSSATRIFSESLDLAKQLGWFDQYTTSTHEILLSKPNSQNFHEQCKWEEDLIIWCFILFKANAVLTAKFPIDGLKFENPVPHILPALDALFHNCDHGWTSSLEARLVYFLYLGFPIFERARIYNHTSRREEDYLPSDKFLHELESIKDSLSEWKVKFCNFSESCRFKPNQLALVTGLHMYYHFTHLLVLIPHLPHFAHQLADMWYVRTYTEFLSSCVSFSALTASQGIWMILYAGATKNFALSLAWSGVRLFIDFVETFNSSHSHPILSDLFDLANMLDPILTTQLQSNLNFSFQRRLNERLIQKRSLLFWLAIRSDHCLKNLGAGHSPRIGCIPPKLARNSKLELLS